MNKFFNPAEHAEIIIPMYGTVHFITLGGLVLLLLLVFWQKETVKKLVNNRRYMLGMVIVYIIIDISYWVFQWAFQVEPVWERFPFHLCGTLSLLMPILILVNNKKWLQFFSYWALCAGFISFVNPSFIHDELWSFAFIHYLIRHYFLFVLPIALQIGWEFKQEYRFFLRSLLALAIYAFLIFLLDWATGANFMHLGKNNPLAIPFLPKSFTVWPWTFPSFVGVGLILLHIGFIGLKGIERRSLMRKL